MYRLGYDLDKDGDFGAQVKICNSAGEPTGDAITTAKSAIMRAYGAVEHAMREAITHTYDAPSFSFFSEAHTVGHHKFNVQDLQSYILFKNKGRANKELMHLMHYHGVENVPLFQQNMERVYARDAHVPQVMKFLANTSMAHKRGFNMLMPVSVDEARSRNAAFDASMGLPEETAELTMENIDDSKPSPPDEPLIEEYEEEEEESLNVAADDGPMIAVDEKMGEIERVAFGSVNREHQPPQPVILEPARPPAVVLKAKPKVVAKPKPDVRDQPEKTTKPIPTSTLTVAPKTRPSQSAPSSGSKRPDPSLPHSSDWAGHTPESTNLEPQSEVMRIDLTDQTSGDLWGAYTGRLSDVRDRPIGADPQMPKGSGREAWGRRHQQTNQTWRPRVRDDARDTTREESRNEEEVIPPWRLNQQRHAQRVARSRFRWAPTGIYGNREPQWEELWRSHPWVENEDDFWYEPSSGEWFVKEYF